LHSLLNALIYKMLNNKELEAVLLLAEDLQKNAISDGNNDFADRMEPIIKSPSSKHFLIRLMDVAFRSSNQKRVSDYVLNLFNNNGNPKGLFNSFEQILIKLYKGIGHYFPFISVPLMLNQIRQVTDSILFFVGNNDFSKHVQKRKEEDIHLNVNLIGEALIGEEEAQERIEAYKALLNQDDINYISIKISTIYSQITSLAYEHSIDVLVEKLSQIYDELLAIHAKTGEWKFVNLDMEEYRDLQMTLDTFKKTLSIERFKNLRAGIVLQAYLPDSYNEFIKLQDWAQKRIEAGGAPIKVRLVKGANMEMEKTESSLEEWGIAPYTQKVHTDANYKKILYQALSEDKLKACQMGIASHNIFDLAFALYIIKSKSLHKYVDIEMLEGMANDTVKSLARHDVNILLYTPIVKKENYNSAIAYLVRRLDEGTQDGNFLKEGFGLTVGSDKWGELKRQFLSAHEMIPTVSAEPKRAQDRNKETYIEQSHFYCVANTDWTLEVNRTWFKEIKKTWQSEHKPIPNSIPIVPQKQTRQTVTIEGWAGFPTWDYELAIEEDYQSFLSSESNWHLEPRAKRAELLRKAAVELEKSRGHLIAIAVSELGKTIAEVDVEVSEAIDFANYYAFSILQLETEVELEEKAGVNLVLSPWNFPVAIPIGGVLASLAAGKRVILKPSTNAAATAYLTSKCLWDAGIPTDVYAFLPAEESTLDTFLSSGNTFDSVILTGGTDTAKFLLERNSELNLYAETGGKNSTVITALADREQGIKNVVQSAFGNAGQKCSATSLLILEEEIFNDERFKILLKDATKSKIHGNPWNLETQIGPLAVPVSKKIQHVLDNTKDEEWLLKPIKKGEFLMTPGIKWGITKDDFEYNNELFGPILCVMKAKDLTEAIELVNGVEYGLTSGLESLDINEINQWKGNIKAGNLYVNRSTTGAIVQRQPFGGMKASNFGFGSKAGGVNYVLQFVDLKQSESELSKAENSYKKWADELFLKEIDYVNLRGQKNINRYLKPEEVLVLIDSTTSKIEIQLVQKATDVLGIKTEFYAISGTEVPNIDFIEISKWTDLELQLNHDIVVRSLVSNSEIAMLNKICNSKAIHIYDRKPSSNGRLELLNYLTEQNFSFNFHRYGNLLGEGEKENVNLH
jgi:RHH-type transcriptional regulator, proline utilization regulon repressor / proline dehydrogenase / delta 1-pyrroline-5-carboxylate dehydrogenase